MQVLGAIQIQDIQDVNVEDGFCFSIRTHDDKWILCPGKFDENVEEWYCKIKSLIGKPCPVVNNSEGSNVIRVNQFI